MSVVIVLAASILFPALILKVLGIIHKKWNLRMYWIIVPLCMAVGIIIPYLYLYILDPNILFSLEQMITYSVKTGFMIFLVIPSLLAGVVCTAIGYIRQR